jgi:hypothetical protein
MDNNDRHLLLAPVVEVDREFGAVTFEGIVC